MRTSKAISRKRLKYAIPSFVVGLGLAALIRWLLGGGFAALEALDFGLLAAAIALWMGEKFQGLPTDDDIGFLRLREEMSPLDLKSENEVPLTLKSPHERSLKL